MRLILADASTGMPGDGIPAEVLLLIAGAGVLALTFVLLAIYVSIKPDKSSKDAPTED